MANQIESISSANELSTDELGHTVGGVYPSDPGSSDTGTAGLREAPPAPQAQSQSSRQWGPLIDAGAKAGIHR